MTLHSVVAPYLFLCSDEDKQAFEAWHAHDDAEDNFCELDGEWESPIYSSSVAHAESDRCGGRLPNSQRRDTEWTIQSKGLLLDPDGVPGQGQRGLEEFC